MIGSTILALRGAAIARGGMPLLGPLDLMVGSGRLVVVIGPNGAGKTLLLKLCHGLVGPDVGAVSWIDPPVVKRGARRDAYVAQSPLMLRRSARDNIVHALALSGVPRAQRHEKAMLALERFGLAPIAERPAPLLSGGEKQRLAIARAASLEPDVLFLDEPTAALDPAAIRAVEELIHGLHAAGVTVVMTTHDLGQARRLADEVILLHHGRIVEHADATSFFKRPQTREARAFLGGELLD